MQNHFKTLGVHRRTTDEELHERYKNLAWEHHPDRGGDTTTFAAINSAYATLRAKKSRDSYLSQLALRCDECPACKGAGARSKAKSMVDRSYRACSACEGCGYTLRRSSGAIHDSLEREEVISMGPKKTGKGGKKGC